MPEDPIWAERRRQKKAAVPLDQQTTFQFDIEDFSIEEQREMALEFKFAKELEKRGLFKGYKKVVQYKDKPIDYIDIAPKPFVVKIPLVEYFERITRHKADRWQHHFCNYLQEAAINRHIKPVKSIIHAEARLGKSRILAQTYPAWLLGHDPMHRIALATYNVSQSEAHSESVIGIINLPIHQAIFPNSTGWVPLKTAKDRWRTNARKGAETDTERSFKAVGLQSGLTGAGFDCFPAETMVKTEVGNLTIGELFVLKYTPKVYAFNHLTKKVELRRIEALREMSANELIEFTTESGRTIRCTPNHRIFVDGRYITADQIVPGACLSRLREPERLLQPSMPRLCLDFTSQTTQASLHLSNVRYQERPIQQRMSTMLIQDEASTGRTGLPSVQENVSRPAIRREQEPESGVQQDILFDRLSSSVGVTGKATSHQTLSQVLDTDRTSNDLSDVLLVKMLAKACEDISDRETVPRMSDDVSTKGKQNGLLRKGLCQQRTFSPHDGNRQFTLHDRQELCEMVSGNEANHFGSRRTQMCNLRKRRNVSYISLARQTSSTEQIKYSSYRSRSVDKHSGEFSDPLLFLSPSSPHVTSDTVSVVKRIRNISVPVYDLQVEGCGNFFAEEILVHNSLIIDDPYADAKEAFSEIVRRNLTNHFWEFTVTSRIGEYSNVFGMFHRYHVEDLAGYLLDKGTFEYLRYASVCDGPYIHESTGQRFDDPLGRAEGEYISERRGPSYYLDKRKDTRVWNSMFQGRPSSEAGDFFKVDKMREVSGVELEFERSKCVLWVRAWDNAATAGGGDYTAGAKVGMQPDGRILIDDVKLVQVDAANRLALQKATALDDGYEVPVCIPKELAEAGKSLVFFTQEYLQGFTVVSRSVTNSAPGSTAKARRAYNFSVAVNSGEVMYASDKDLPQDDQWNSTVLRAMRNFLFTSFDDPIDAMGDGYNYLFEQMSRGLLVSNYRPQRNLLSSQAFTSMFPNKEGVFKVPPAFTVYAGVKISSDTSKPTSAVLVCRASMNTNLPETLFILAEYKEYNGDYEKLFFWLKTSLSRLCSNATNIMVWLHPDSSHFQQTILEKVGVNVAVFDADSLTGYTELNWYFLPIQTGHPETITEQGSRMYALIDEGQRSMPVNPSGLINLRQELATCGFNEKGEPTATVAVLDCLRMCVAEFTTHSTPLTEQEAYTQRLRNMLPAPIAAQMGTGVVQWSQPGEIATDITLEMNEMMLKSKMRQEGEYVRASPFDDESDEYEPSFENGW